LRINTGLGYRAIFFGELVDPKLLLEHELVPEHIIMKKEEVVELLKKYGVTKEKLPKILEKDPVVVAIGAKKGNVLKVIRDSITAGKAEYYRLVI